MIIIINPITETMIIIGRYALMEVTFWLVCLFIDWPWLVAEETAKKKNIYIYNMRNVEHEHHKLVNKMR